MSIPLEFRTQVKQVFDDWLRLCDEAPEDEAPDAAPDGVPAKMAPLGSGAGTAEADAPFPTRSPIPCCLTLESAKNLKQKRNKKGTHVHQNSLLSLHC